MKRCTRCRCRLAPDDYRRCDRCRAKCRDRDRAYYWAYGRPRHISKHDKVLAWLRAAPRNYSEIAGLLSITPDHAKTLLYTLKRRGRIERVTPARFDGGSRYRVI